MFYVNVADSPSMLSVVLTGLVIVFALLVFFVLVFSVFGLFSKSKKKKPVSDTAKPTEVKEPVQKPAQSVQTVSDDDEVIAVISAVVFAMYENTGVRPVIRSVRPAKSSGRTAWANAGLINNVKSF